MAKKSAYATREQIEKAKTLIKAMPDWKPNKIVDETGVSYSTACRLRAEIHGPSYTKGNKQEQEETKQFVGTIDLPEINEPDEIEDPIYEQLELFPNESTSTKTSKRFMFTSESENAFVKDMVDEVTSTIRAVEKLGVEKISYRVVIESAK